MLNLSQELSKLNFYFASRRCNNHAHAFRFTLLDHVGGPRASWECNNYVGR